MIWIIRNDLVVLKVIPKEPDEERDCYCFERSLRAGTSFESWEAAEQMLKKVRQQWPGQYAIVEFH